MHDHLGLEAVVVAGIVLFAQQEDIGWPQACEALRRTGWQARVGVAA
ncbi:MAG: hypothetical protein ACO3AC_09330 [Hylemonella sp.]